MNKIKLPPDVEFHEDLRLFIHRPKGVLNKRVVNRVVLALGDLEAKQKAPFNRFADTLEADAADLNFRYIIQVSLHRRLTYAGHPPIKSAILATDATIIHYARLLALLTQGSSIKVQVFAERKEAAQWLGVPLELLEAKVSGGAEQRC